MTKNFQHVLSLVFALKEINENPRILPNVSLGFHIYDSYFNAKMTYQTILNLLFSLKEIVPNYKCDTQKNLIAAIGGLDSEVSQYMATFLNAYKIPQVGYACKTLQFYRYAAPCPYNGGKSAVFNGVESLKGLPLK